MWVRLSGWMIADEEPSLPRAGSVLADLGLRVRGDVTPAPPGAQDGVVEIQANKPYEVMYRLTGSRGEPTDYAADFGRGSEHAGVELVLTVGSERYQVQSDGWARDIPAASRVVVSGRLAFVGGYEWDAFGLTDTAASHKAMSMAPTATHRSPCPPGFSPVIITSHARNGSMPVPPAVSSCSAGAANKRGAKRSLASPPCPYRPTEA